MSCSTDTVSRIRHASRQMVRELGFIGSTLAGTNLSGSAVHAIIEIAGSDGVTARELGRRLLLEKSTISRLVAGLVRDSLVSETRSGSDGRLKKLTLTPRGREMFASIETFARGQVIAALETTEPATHNKIVEGLEIYANALTRSRASSDGSPSSEVPLRIQTGYRPGLAGRMVAMMAEFYARTVAFDRGFEATIAGHISDFLTRLDAPHNELWSIEHDGRLLGTVGIDGDNMGQGCAQLRWFILDYSITGRGFGKALMTEAMAFCDRVDFREAQLWTFKGLWAARSLYDRHGFTVVEEQLSSEYGGEVLLQRMVRPMMPLA